MSNQKDIRGQFGKRVRQFREGKGYSQDRLAVISGLHRTYISSIERGKRNVSLKNIEVIAKSLDVKITDLFEDAS